MTELRQRMMTDMKLHGLAPGTQKVYLNAVRRLAGHYHRSPDQLSEQQLRDYFTYLVEEKRVPSSTLRTEIFGVKFLFDKTLGRPWPTLKFLRARPSYKLPVVLDREEARRLIGLIRCPAVRMGATMMYSCGLRISEALGLKIADIDSARMVVIVRGEQGEQRSPRSAAEADARTAAGVLACVSPHHVPVGHQGRSSSGGSPCAVLSQKGREAKWNCQTDLMPHAQAFLRDESDGRWPRCARHSGAVGTSQSEDHHPLPAHDAKHHAVGAAGD